MGLFDVLKRVNNPKLTIELHNGGALVTIKNHLDVADGNTFSEIFKFDENDKQGLLELLYCVDNFCVWDEGKYSKERADINLVHGSKYDCKDDKCPICKGEPL